MGKKKSLLHTDGYEQKVLGQITESLQSVTNQKKPTKHTKDESIAHVLKS